METVNYKCPNCAAPLIFSIEKKGWNCDFCGSFFPEEEIEQIASSQGEAALEQPFPDIFADGEMKAYVCPDCGGRVLAKPQEVTSFCPYCHNPTVLASQLEGEYKPQKIIPFRITKEQALETIHKATKGKLLLPKAFRQCIKQGEISGMYVPYWLFGANYEGTLLIQGAKYQYWSDSRYNYTRTSEYEVPVTGNVPFFNVPVPASKEYDSTTMGMIEPFRYDELKEFRMEYLSGYLAESYQLDRHQSRPRFEAPTRQQAESLYRQMTALANPRITQGSLQPNYIEEDYVMLPVWTVSIRHKEEIYTYYVNGQTGKGGGVLPFSWGRLLSLGAGVSAGVFALVLIISLLGGFYFL